ncbi:MAG TPA: hypothetical protein VHM70_30965 [Polyangiaceae bacterium]|nr:hypothetical protein [Polyangiaceae bacterium]
MRANNESTLTRITRAALLSLGLLSPLSCKGILGIEERSLDTEELTVDGYSGCQPEDGVCDGCTSTWHTCICKGWKAKPEAVLRKDCAAEAPAEIRAAVVKKADAKYKAYKASIADDSKSDDGPDADAGNISPSKPHAGQGSDGGQDDAVTNDDALADDALTDDALSDDTSVIDDLVSSDDGLVVGSDAGQPGPDLPVLEIFDDQFCKEPATNDCVGCICGECGPEVDTCRGDRGCSLIMDCKLKSQCDPAAPDGTDHCYEVGACKAVILAQGGVDGESYKNFQSLIHCGLDSQCPCSNNPTQMLCLNSDGCPAGGTSCNATDGCQCSNCMDECMCTGGAQSDCQAKCQTGEAAECVETTRCDGCSSCEADCECENVGTSLAQCQEACGDASCGPGHCDACSSCQAQCECGGQTPLECLKSCESVSCGDSLLPDCDRCACEKCTSEYGQCREAKGCMDVFICMAQTNCKGLADCNGSATCGMPINNAGGPDSQSVAIAEALNSCRSGAKCACGGPPPSIECGGMTCNGSTAAPPNPVAGPCCPSGNDPICGYVAAPLFGPNHNGECVALDRFGVLDAGCPKFAPMFAPYNGATLEGCCGSDGLCGYKDTFNGLGCASAKWFGPDEPPACTLPR